MDYLIRKYDGWYAVCIRGSDRIVRGPFRWEWMAQLSTWI